MGQLEYLPPPSGLTDFVSVVSKGADPTGTVDSTPAFVAANLTGKRMWGPPGTYLLAGWRPLDYTYFYGAGLNKTILKSPAGITLAGQSPIVMGTLAPDTGVVGCTFRDFTVDGNKSALIPGNDTRGIYILGLCANNHFERVEVTNCQDHGWLTSGADCCAQTKFIDCRATNNGSAAHLAAGGSGGSGFVVGHDTCDLISCFASGNWLNGFKFARGNWTNCIADGNQAGFETGFSPTSSTRATMIACRSINAVTGGGFRHQGQGDYFTMIGCTAANNFSGGIVVFNVVERAIITGNYVYNNGLGGVQNLGAGISDSGIAIFNTGLNGPSDIYLSGNQIFDDQATPTQRYGLLIGDEVSNIDIAPTNIIGQNKVQDIFVSVTGAGQDTLFVDAYYGASQRYRNKTSTSVTGTTTSNQALMNTTIAANAWEGAKIAKLYGGGSVTGTNGSKTIKVNVNGSFVTLMVQAAGSTNRWWFEATIMTNGSRKAVSVSSYEDGVGPTGPQWVDLSHSRTTSLVIGCVCTLANAGDTVTQDFMYLKSI